ncbi:hypothetical protein Tco_0173399 [Tanacetum coccineum]
MNTILKAIAMVLVGDCTCFRATGDGGSREKRVVYGGVSVWSAWRDLFAVVGLGSAVVPADKMSVFVACVSDLWRGIVETIVSAMSSMVSYGGVPVKSML